ncbi:40-residue YVTN family beta-propeller repeat-containing protein [Arthrobacter sp. ov407]|uniref:FG-GAP-like repeat-containing protein n=1 Tax=Arthrobacter sp. ov407 TaxID=1761748 RepID=UPI0008925AC7|nr:FG-GAP-like repeat-containing protein [Arthrobacter sp. ov407]SDL26954.1 40-residue YVTN family beta-propeller repeat-containing protein [Arthrobacter sp. ov407]
MPITGSPTTAATTSSVDTPDISTTAVPDAVVGQQYHAALAANGGSGPYSWSLAGGVLPEGVTLDPKTGVLAGIPKVNGTSHPMITLTDSQGASSMFTTALAVQAAPKAALPLLMTGVRSITEGQYADYAVRDDGTALAWGNNTYGSLGNGTFSPTQVLSPTEIPGLNGVVSISTTTYGAQLALKADGTVWSWGTNAYGELGIGTTLPSSSPRQVTGLTGVRTLAVDRNSIFAVKSDGTVHAWGQNDLGQLGNATFISSSTPVQVAGLVGVKSIAPCGDGIFIAYKIDGTLWKWGGWSSGIDPLPAVAIPHISGVRTMVASRYAKTVYALKFDGTLWSAGSNSSGQRGYSGGSDNDPAFQHFAPIAGLSDIQSVSTIDGGSGSGTAFAVKKDGTAWAWGNNSFGVLGTGTTAARSSTPQPIPGLTDVQSISSNTFGRAIYALTVDGTVWGWGEGGVGEFGTGAVGTVTLPIRIPGLSNVVALLPGDESAYAIRADRSVWGWGVGVSKRLSDGTRGYSVPPLQLGSSNSFPAGVGTGLHPAGVALSPDGTAAYVANEGSNTLSVVDPENGTVRTTLPVGNSPRGVAISPDGAQAFVTNSGDNTVSVINTATGALAATIAVGSGWGASAVAFTPDGAKAYVTNAGEGTVAVIDVGSASVGAVIPVGVEPVAVSITPDGTQAIVTNFSDDTVSVIETATDRVVKTMPVSGGPRSVVVTPDGLNALVSCGGTNSISVVHLATTQVSTVQVGSRPAGVALTASGTRALVASTGSNELSVVDVASGRSLGTFPTGTSPSGVAVAPDGSTALVTNSGGETVSIVKLGPAMGVALPAAATVGVPYAYHFNAGITPPPAYSVSSGSLPAGLTLDSRTGTLSGKPTVAGTSTFSVTASTGTAPDATASALTITVVTASTVPSMTRGAWRDFNGDGISDLLFRYDDGTLAVLGGSTKGTSSSVSILSPGWARMNAVVFPGDFTGDAKTDILARDSTGALWLYPGKGDGPLLPRIKLGSGWNTMTAIVGVGDFKGHGRADVLARDTTGVLWLYPGNGKGGWLPRIRIGAGWNSMTALTSPRDFNGDGRSDLLARDTTGVLWLYPGNGKGGWLPRIRLGAGWNIMTAVFGAGDFNGDGKADVLARDKANTLWLYPGSGKGGWLPRVNLGKDYAPLM